MTCAELEILLCEYVDGTVPASVKDDLERHVAGCAVCARLVEDVVAAAAFLKKAEPVEAPAELLTRLLFQVPAAEASRDRRGVRALFGRWFQPLLQPRFAMGMAMTILSFSLLARFAGIPGRQLSQADLNPARVWASVDERWHRTWDRVVKYYESLRVVYEIQNRLGEWSEGEPAPSPRTDGADGGSSSGQPEPAEPGLIPEDAGRSVNQ